jgi:hypothetical protein
LLSIPPRHARLLHRLQNLPLIPLLSQACDSLVLRQLPPDLGVVVVADAELRAQLAQQIVAPLRAPVGGWRGRFKARGFRRSARREDRES